MGRIVVGRFMGRRRRSERRIASRSVPAGRFGQEADRAESRWLADRHDGDELLLGWLAVADVELPEEAPPVGGRSRWRLWLGDRRQALVAFGRGSQVTEVSLPAATGYVSQRWGRATLQIGDYRITSERGNDELFVELAPLVGLDRDGRVREVARASWRCRKGEELHKPFVVALLQWLSERTAQPLDELAWLCIAGQIDPVSGGPGDRLERCLGRLVESDCAAGDVGRWAEDWQIAAADKRIIVERLRSLSPVRRAAALSLSLRRQLRAEPQGGRRGSLADAHADVSFAEHLALAGFRREAERILEERLALLGESSLDDLSVGAGKEGVLIGGELGAARRAVLERLADLQVDDEPQHRRRLGELARLEPVSHQRIAALREAGDPDLVDRAAVVVGLLGPGALAKGAPHQLTDPAGPIDRAELEVRLPHPAAREPSTVVQIQQWLGRAKQPDYATIRSYSERATAEDYPSLLDALADATLVLGVDGVEGFVSRGERRLGVRAYDASPPFLVIGGDHLDRDSDLFLGEGELRFAVGAEVAHLRFGYTRLTSSELWDGVLYRGKQALDLASMLAGPLGAVGNLLRGAQQVSTVERVLRQVGTVSRKAASVLGVAKEIQQVWTPGTPGQQQAGDELATGDPAELLSACRAMQLGADRAGLLLSGDLRAALRGVFLSTRAYAAELRMAERHGLAKSLSRRDADGELPQPELSLRLASLCAFYLSEDYGVLRDALAG
jgi:hypothetical protein